MTTAAQLLLPTFEGLPVAAFELSFGGKVPLDLSFEADEALIGECKLGRRVRVTVEGVIVAKPFRYTEGDEKTDDSVTSGARLDVRKVVLEDVGP
jgi:hypothetical protein